MKRMLLLMVLLVAATGASAQITVVGHWRLGDMDAGASAGAASAGTTVNSISSSHALAREGSHLYSADTPDAARLTAGASAFSILFSGAGTYAGYYTTLQVAGGTLPAYTQNFAIEAWIKPGSTTAGTRVIVTAGDQDSGYSIVQSGGALEVRYGTNGAALATFAGVSTTEWTHVALVRGAATATFYVNGQSAGATSAAIPGWGTSFEYFGIGEQPRGPGGQNFVGLIDEVRLFTFVEGTFATTMLNYTAVPEPGAVALWLGVAALALASVRRRGRAA